VRQGETWRVGAEFGQSQDDLTGLEGSSWLVGASRRIDESLAVGLAWTSADIDRPVSLAAPVGHEKARNEGLVVELSVGKW
jgi:hypothetical protein